MKTQQKSYYLFR